MRRGRPQRRTEADAPSVRCTRERARRSSQSDRFSLLRLPIESPQLGWHKGFCAVDPSNGTIWALFVDAVYEGRGIGRQLLAMRLTDLREAGWAEARPSTEVGSRAERGDARAGRERRAS